LAPSKAAVTLNVRADAQAGGGSCDLLIAYHHLHNRFQLDPNRYEMVTLGAGGAVAYRLTQLAPEFKLPVVQASLCLTLGMRQAYLGRVVGLLVQTVQYGHSPRQGLCDMAEA
jgi:hypothetical protein